MTVRLSCTSLCILTVSWMPSAIVSVSIRICVAQADPSTALMFAARAGSMGAFTVLFLYTPEVRHGHEFLHCTLSLRRQMHLRGGRTDLRAMR